MTDSNGTEARSLWRGRFFSTNPVVRFSVQAAVTLSALVALPALVARQWADERFVMYMPEHIAGSKPWTLVTRAIDEIPGYLDTGVFRPLSRMLFYLEHWAVVRFGAATGIPPNVVMAAVKIVMIFALVTMVMMTIEQYRRAAGGRSSDVHWRRLYGFTAVLIAISLVLFNPATHPLTLFPGLYLGTAVVALAVPLWFGRSWLRYRAGKPMRRMWIRVGSAVIIGAMLASMLELAYLALPLGFIHLLLLSFAAGDSWVTTWKEMFHSESFLLWALVSTGFIVVFIPVRQAITQYCQELACYRQTEISFGTDAISTFFYRAGASLFPVAQLDQIAVLRRVRGTPEFLLLAVVGAVLAYLVLTRTVIEYEDDSRGRRPRLPMALIGAYFVAVLFFASLLASVSAGVQDKGATISPWRETGFTWIAWAVILAVILTVAYDWIDTRWATVGVVVLAVLLGMTSIANQADMASSNSRTDSRLYNEVGLLLVNFDNTPEGNAQRCDVLDDLREFAPRESELNKMNLIALYIDSAADNIYGTVFCDSDSS